MFYINNNSRGINIEVNLVEIFNEFDIKTTNEKDSKFVFNICTYEDLAKSGHWCRIKIMSDNSDFSISINNDGLIHNYSKTGNKHDKISALTKEERKAYKVARAFADDAGDLINEYQNYKNPPTKERMDELKNQIMAIYNDPIKNRGRKLK